VELCEEKIRCNPAAVVSRASVHLQAYEIQRSKSRQCPRNWIRDGYAWDRTL